MLTADKVQTLRELASAERGQIWNDQKERIRQDINDKLKVEDLIELLNVWMRARNEGDLLPALKQALIAQQQLKKMSAHTGTGWAIQDAEAMIVAAIAKAEDHG